MSRISTDNGYLASADWATFNGKGSGHRHLRLWHGAGRFERWRDASDLHACRGYHRQRLSGLGGLGGIQRRRQRQVRPYNKRLSLVGRLGDFQWRWCRLLCKVYAWHPNCRVELLGHQHRQQPLFEKWSDSHRFWVRNGRIRHYIRRHRSSHVFTSDSINPYLLHGRCWHLRLASIRQPISTVHHGMELGILC